MGRQLGLTTKAPCSVDPPRGHTEPVKPSIAMTSMRSHPPAVIPWSKGPQSLTLRGGARKQ
jgi:hypothetical protein